MKAADIEKAMNTGATVAYKRPRATTVDKVRVVGHNSALGWNVVTGEGSHHWVQPRELIGIFSDQTPTTEADRAGLGVMNGIIDVLNDREFCDQPINPNAETITQWYEQFIAPAVDRIEDEIRRDSTAHGVIPEELANETAPISVQTATRKLENAIQGDSSYTLSVDYSGRGMFGSTCLAVIGTERKLAALLATTFPSEDPADVYMRTALHTDNLGYRSVWYWPALRTRQRREEASYMTNYDETAKSVWLERNAAENAATAGDTARGAERSKGEPVMGNTSQTLPPGAYYVGDPCYAFDAARRATSGGDMWIDLLQSANYQDNPTILEAEVPGHTFVAAHTKYGDGEYRDQFGNVYAVDAGLIGVVPVGHEAPESSTIHMCRHTFEWEFNVSYDDGLIRIGYLEINTDDENDDDDYY